jgi:hypothetical protein
MWMRAKKVVELEHQGDICFPIHLVVISGHAEEAVVVAVLLEA